MLSKGVDDHNSLFICIHMNYMLYRKWYEIKDIKCKYEDSSIYTYSLEFYMKQDICVHV